MIALLRYPMLMAGLVVLWLLLTRLSTGHLLLGMAVAAVATWSVAALRPARPRFRRWQAIPRLLGLVTADILRSNLAVAWLIVTGGRRGQRQSGFVRVRLDLRDPNALALLAIIITATPGTAWLDYDQRSGQLLIHVFDLREGDDWQKLIGEQYAGLLQEIFE